MPATTTKTKTTIRDRHYPPAEIRENTKARRAWVEAKIVELKAQPDTDAKSVQSGSYQHVVEYALTKVAARVQIRGTCQFCANEQALENGLLVLHGYTRPGDGYIEGRCAGMHGQPAEISIDDAKRYVGSLRTQATQEEQKLAELEAEMITLGEWAYDVSRGRKAPTVNIYRLRSALRGGFKRRSELTAAETRAIEFDRIENLIPALRGQAKTIETHVFPKLGGKLREVLI